MSTMNISLSDSLKSYVDERVQSQGYSTASEFVRSLIREDQAREHLRAMLIEGAQSPVQGQFDSEFFDDLRAHLHQMRSAQ